MFQFFLDNPDALLPVNRKYAASLKDSDLQALLKSKKVVRVRGPGVSWSYKRCSYPYLTLSPTWQTKSNK